MTTNNSDFFVEKKVLSGLILVLLLLIGLIILLSFVPPTSKDALVHHLAVPKLYLKHGGIYEIPYMDFSYYPMNLDLLYIIPLYFGNDIAPKFIHFAFGLLTAWLIFHYIKSRANSGYGLLGVIFFLSIPIIVKLSITVYVDLGEIFFSFAAFLLMLEWIKSKFKLRFLVCSGIMCGLALGTKYNGLVTLLILTLFIPFLYSRYTQQKGIGFIRSPVYGIIFICISLLVFSPWMIRNYYWKGNPIYPLYKQIFNPPDITTRIKTDTHPENNEIKQDLDILTYRSLIYHESGWEIALLPLRIFFQGKDGDPQFFDGTLNPFLFIMPFFAFYRLRNDPEDLRREKNIMLAFSVLFFFIALFTAVLRIRYVSPIIPPLVLLSVFGVRNLFNAVNGISHRINRQLGRVFVLGGLVFALVLNGHYIIGQLQTVAPLSFIAGKISHDAYISEYIPEYPALKYINSNLDSDAKILFIFLGRRGYYCDREYLFDMGMLKNIIVKSDEPKDILKGLKEKYITHLLVNYSLFGRWMKDNFSEKEILLTQQFFREYVVPIFYEKGFGVSALSDFQ